MSENGRTRIPATLSLDLDNKWSYLKTHGDPQWERLPSYLDVVVPRALEMLGRRGTKISFFIVGKDASDPRHDATLASIPAAGHEIGNHSYNHEPWLHLYSERQLEEELARAEESIQRATGQRPVGFRGPGFSLSRSTLEVLSRRGYRYDASTLPTFIGPLARAYYFATSRLSAEEKEQRRALYGSVSDALRPLDAYLWTLGDRSLLEIPVTTMPVFRVPIHVSYVLYLSLFSVALAKLYFSLAVRMCRLTRTAPSILLHPLDLMGREDDDELAFFPAMRASLASKLRLVEYCLDLLDEHFEVMRMIDYADRLLATETLRRVRPEFGLAATAAQARTREAGT